MYDVRVKRYSRSRGQTARPRMTIKIVGPAIAEGEWTWTWGRRSVRFAAGIGPGDPARTHAVTLRIVAATALLALMAGCGPAASDRAESYRDGQIPPAAARRDRRVPGRGLLLPGLADPRQVEGARPVPGAHALPRLLPGRRSRRHGLADQVGRRARGVLLRLRLVLGPRPAPARARPPRRLSARALPPVPEVLPARGPTTIRRGRRRRPTCWPWSTTGSPTTSGGPNTSWSTASRW